MKKGIMTTVEISNAHVKVLHARSARLFHYAAHKITDDSEDSLAKAVSQAGLPKDAVDGQLIVVIPRQFVFLKQISLPSQSDEEIRKMVSLQLVNYVPYARDEIIFDISIIQKDGAGYTKVLLVAVHKNIVHRYHRILSKAGFAFQKFVVSSFGLVDWFIHQSRQKKQEEKGPLVLINIDYQNTDISFCFENRLIFSRNINFGSLDVERDLEEFLEQISMSMGAYQKISMGDQIQKIILVASDSIGPEVANKLVNYYQLPIEIYDSLKGLPVDRNFQKSLLEDQEFCSIAAGAGFLLNENSGHINLMPAEFEDTKQQRLAKKILTKFFAIFLLTLFLSFAAIGIGNYHDLMYLKKVESKIDEIDSGINKAKRQMRFLDFIKDETQHRTLVADIFEELYELTPEEIAFQSLHLGLGRALIIQGLADSSSRVNQFQKNLVNSEIFRDVTLQYATKRKRFKQEYTDFKITCALQVKLDPEAE